MGGGRRHRRQRRRRDVVCFHFLRRVTWTEREREKKQRDGARERSRLLSISTAVSFHVDQSELPSLASTDATSFCVVSFVRSFIHSFLAMPSRFWFLLAPRCVLGPDCVLESILSSAIDIYVRAHCVRFPMDFSNRNRFPLD